MLNMIAGFICRLWLVRWAISRAKGYGDTALYVDGEVLLERMQEWRKSARCRRLFKYRIDNKHHAEDEAQHLIALALQQCANEVESLLRADTGRLNSAYGPDICTVPELELLPLPKIDWDISRLEDGRVVAAIYESPVGVVHHLWFNDNDLPNKRISRDDLMRFGIAVP